MKGSIPDNLFLISNFESQTRNANFNVNKFNTLLSIFTQLNNNFKLFLYSNARKALDINEFLKLGNLIVYLRLQVNNFIESYKEIERSVIKQAQEKSLKEKNFSLVKSNSQRFGIKIINKIQEISQEEKKLNSAMKESVLTKCIQKSMKQIYRNYSENKLRTVKFT